MLPTIGQSYGGITKGPCGFPVKFYKEGKAVRGQRGCLGF